MSMLHPGVELSETTVSLPLSEEETAVPVFIGYTEDGVAQSVIFIESMDDFTNLLGGPDSSGDRRSILYYAVQHYFDNGGRPCFVYPVNNYQELANCDSAAIAAAVAEITTFGAASNS